MSEKDDGGLAFPYEERNGDGQPVVDHYGMSLRDYMAIHANKEDIAAQLLILRAKSEYGILPDNYVAVARYMHADAMIEERNK